MEHETVEVPPLSSDNHKKIRHRKKQLYHSILKQMEFYFGDANLSKDRFLGEKIKEDPYIPLTTFLQFNKLKALTDNVDDIVKSLVKSEILKLSEDETSVRRITPIKERIDIDDCTVYVECLPPNIDHEWLRNIFISFGPVSYVSIPRFKHNKKIKGFAFIEFEDASSALKCLEAFEEAGSKLLPGMNPDDLCSISTFEDPKHVIHNIESVDKNEEDVMDDCQPISSDQKTEKRKISVSDSDDKEISKKRRRTESKEDKNDKNNDSKNCDDASIAKKIINEIPKDLPQKEDIANTSGVETGEDNEADGCTDNKKKKRKRKKQVKKYRDSIASTGLKILSKNEWKKLRNKYLNLQRTKMHQLKKQLHLNRVNEYHKRNPVQYQQNFYGGSDENNSEAMKEEIENPATPVVEFTPGVIVNLKLKESCVDIKGFKAAMRNISEEIKYVDINEGAIEAHLRFSENSFASKFSSLLEEATSIHTPDIIQIVNQISSQSVLSGESEQEYWKKVARDRDTKRNKLIKLDKRGKDKLIAKAIKNSHLRFDED